MNHPLILRNSGGCGRARAPLHFGNRARVTVRPLNPRSFWRGAFIPLGVLASLLLRQTWFQRTRPGELYSALDAFNIAQILLTGLAAVYLLLPEVRLAAILGRLKGRAVLWVIGYYFFACASALWSTQPLYSCYIAGETVVLLTLLLVLFARCRDFYQAEELAVGLTVLSIALEMLTAGYRGGLSFAALHTNTFSCSAAMLLVYGVGEALASNRPLRPALKLALIVGPVSLVAGTSTGSNLACLAALCLIIVLARKFTLRHWLLIGGVALLVLGIVTMQQSDWARTLLGRRSLEAVTSGQHRLRLWENAFSVSLNSFFVGYGFCVGPKEHLMLTNAHNSFLELTLNTGVVGLAIYSWALVKMVLELRAARSARSTGALGVAAAFCAVLANSLSVSVLAFSWTPPGLSFYSFLALFTLYCRPAGHAAPAIQQPAGLFRVPKSWRLIGRPGNFAGLAPRRNWILQAKRAPAPEK